LRIDSVFIGRGFFGRSVLHQFDEQHRAQAPDITDQRMTPLPSIQRLAQNRADPFGAREEGGLTHRLDRGDRGDAGQRVAAVGAAHPADVGGVHDVCAAGDGADRHARAERLGGDDDVGRQAVVLQREQPARAGETALHFVGDHHDAVLVAELANPLQEAGRHRHESAFSLNRLDDDRRHLRRVDLRGEREFELLDPPVDALLGAHALRAAIDVGHWQPHDLRGERTHAFLEEAVLAREAQRQQRAAVVRALETDDGWPPGVRACCLHRVLHRFGAAVGQQRLLREAAGCHLVEQLAHAHVRFVRAHERAHVHEFLRCFVHRLDDGGWAVAHGQRADAAHEVDEGVAVDVVYERAFRALDYDIGRLTEAGRNSRRATSQHRPALRAWYLGLQLNR
jgi:hypothetical protein